MHNINVVLDYPLTIMQVNISIQEISYLYELSLSIGQSLDIRENCENFINKMISHKNLEFGAVWIKNQFIPLQKKQDGYSLIYANPKSKICPEELKETPLLQKILLEERSFSDIISSSLGEAVGLNHIPCGSITIFPLKKIGFVIALSSLALEVMAENELKRLEDIMQKFTVSVKGSLYHEKSVQDLIKLTKTQQDLEQAKRRAEESEQLKISFLSNISHEIRTPVNSILGFASLLSSNDVNSSQQETFIRRIHDNSQELLNLISDIIDFSRLETDQLEIYKENHYLNPILFEQFQTFKHIHQKEEKSFEFRINIPQGSEDKKIVTDKNRLQQILKNLLNNAFKFTNNGFVELGYCIGEDDNTPVFYVKDSGIGIPNDKQKIIFNKFQQIEHSTTRKYGGVGLGLPIITKLIELMGGELYMESEEGIGSCFYFSLNQLPVIEHPNLKTSSTRQYYTEIDERTNSEYDFSNRTILIAEDVKTNYYYLNAIIELTNAKIVWVQNGEEAVLKCKNEAIDLILMDIRMPVLSGKDAIRQIRSVNPNIPIIVQTAFTLNNEKSDCYQAGANDFIAKPINPQQLLKLLLKHL